MSILIDTGPLVAYAVSNDKDHERVRAVLEAAGEQFLAPITVLPEVCYLIERQLGARAEARFLESLAKGELLVEPVTGSDLLRSAELVSQYADNPFDLAQDRPIGFVDASLVAVAERLNIARILTLDRRHFSAIRPRHVPAFELLP